MGTLTTGAFVSVGALVGVSVALGMLVALAVRVAVGVTVTVSVGSGVAVGLSVGTLVMVDGTLAGAVISPDGDGCGCVVAVADGAAGGTLPALNSPRLNQNAPTMMIISRTPSSVTR